MNYMIDLKPHIGSEKTLLITGDDFCPEEYITLTDRVFVYNVPRGMLLRYNPEQQEMLQHHVCEIGCSQVIYVGSNETALLKHLQNSASPQSPHLALRFNLSVLLRNHNEKAIRSHIKRQMLLELHVIEQSKLLLDYFFIRKKVEDGDLRLKGIVTELDSPRFKSIFLNGIAYNDLLTLN